MNNISCVIHTYNSEKYLAPCLNSVKWCDEIVIIDMYSRDSTVEIAQKYGAKVYFHENVGIADPAREFGKTMCSFSWILAIDSDEIVPTALAIKLREIAQNDEVDVVEISFRNFFFGREILGTGWGFKNQVIPRFFRKNHLSYGNEVHNFTKISPQSRVIKIISSEMSIIHFNYDSVSHFISKLNRYTDHEVNKNKSSKNIMIRIIFHFLREFIGRYFYLKGYRDGWLGFYLSYAMGFYRATTIAKTNLPSENEVVNIYKNIADNLEHEKNIF
jgi:glycosyltransferase involved in cell wall biosynthesis